LKIENARESAWTDSETKLFTKYFIQFGHDPVSISAHIQTKTPRQVLSKLEDLQNTLKKNISEARQNLGPHLAQQILPDEWTDAEKNELEQVCSQITDKYLKRTSSIKLWQGVAKMLTFKKER
jgi:hypothetical protein